jgi:hypothetical protein
LDGLEQLLAQHFPEAKWKAGKRWTPKVNLVRYADDCAPRAKSEQMSWLNA